MPHGPYPNHRTPPPHIYQHQPSILDFDQLAGHCHALTHIMPILCQSEDSCACKRGTSVLCGPTEVSPRRTSFHAVRATAPKHRKLMRRQSSNSMQIQDQSANPIPILDQSVNPLPIYQSGNSMPIVHQYRTNPASLIHPSFNHRPILSYLANTLRIRQSTTNLTILCTTCTAPFHTNQHNPHNQAIHIHISTHLTV